MCFEAVKIISKVRNQHKVNDYRFFSRGNLLLRESVLDIPATNVRLYFLNQLFDKFVLLSDIVL